MCTPPNSTELYRIILLFKDINPNHFRDSASQHMRSFSYSHCQLQESPYIRWYDDYERIRKRKREKLRADSSSITAVRNRLLIPDTCTSWRHMLQRRLLLSLSLSTTIEIRSGHSHTRSSPSSSASSSSGVLCADLEGGQDRLLLSGGQDCRVCLYRLDMPRDSGGRGIATVQPVATSARSTDESLDGHGGAVSSVQW